MVNYNPHTNTVLGPELTPRSVIAQPFILPVAGSADGIIESFTSTATETVNALGKWFKNLFTAPGYYGPQGMTLVEILTTDVALNVAQATYVPNASSQTGVTGTYADLVPGVGVVYNTATDTDGSISVDFNTAGALTGKRILRVRWLFEVAGVSYVGRQQTGIEIDGFDVGYPAIITATGTEDNSQVWRTVEVDAGELEPIAGTAPWTVANVQAFDAGSYRFTLRLNVAADPFVPANNDGISFVRNLRCVVDYCDENRVAANVVVVPSGGDLQRVYWTPTKVDGSANWAKVNATAYSMVTRAPRVGNANVAVNYGDYDLNVGVLANPTFTDVPAGLPVVRRAPTMGLNGNILARGPVDARMFIDLEIMVASVGVADSSVYAYGYDNGGAVWTSLQQEYTQSTGGPLTYAGVRLIGRYQPDANGDVSDLTVTLRRRSDNVVMATGTVTREDVDDADVTDTGYGMFSLIQVPFVAAFALVSGTQYYVDLTATNKDDWVFPTLVITPASSLSAQGWHGGTDRGTFNGVESSEYDFPWLLFQTIAAPAAFAAVGASQPVEVAADICDGVLHDDCLVYAIGLVHLTWTATALGGLFDYYEIQRQDQYGTWATIALVDLEATDEFYDFEARLGLTSSYRIRAVTTVGVYGSWSTTVNATAPVSGTGLTFTSNSNPAGNIAYSDIYDAEAERVWVNDEAADLITQKLAGRDFVVAFQGCERRGLSFAPLLLVNALGAPSVVGVHAFDALRDLAKSHIPAVCVRNHEGDRWFVAMTVPDVRIREAGHWYTAPITCVEVMGNPAPVAS